MHTAALGHDGAGRAPILFISHDAWRTGAPLVLLHFLQWLRAHTNEPFAVILRDGAGDVRSAFEAVAPVTTWHELSAAGGSAASTRLIRMFRHDPPHERLRRWLGGHTPSLVYSNTITNGTVLEALAPLGVPVLTHVHELEFWMKHRMAPDDLVLGVRHSTRFVAVAEAVRRVLVEQLGVAPPRVDVVNEFVPAHEPAAPEHLAVLRARHGIPEDVPVVGGVGTTDWRKGTDLFVQVAARVSRTHSRVHFVWVGGKREGLVPEQLRHDARRAGIEDRFHLVGDVPSARAYFDLFTVLALPSREDPFPLVCLEAAAAACPVVCFDGAGGAPEFVRSDAGIVTPYLDVDRFSGAVLRLLEDEPLRATLGATGAARVRERHEVGVVAPALLQVGQDLRRARA
jgi:glycosyltransferase involved in cell wall biosynthesis